MVEFEVIKTFEKPLERQVAEAVFIHNCKADKLLNSKAEWEQPAIERLIVTRELPEAGEPGAGRGRGRGRRQGGANQWLRQQGEETDDLQAREGAAEEVVFLKGSALVKISLKEQAEPQQLQMLL